MRARYPLHERIYVVLDNFSPHRRGEIRRWAKRNNVVFVWTPTNASWLNRIECQFTELKKFVFHNTYFRSHAERKSFTFFSPAILKEWPPISIDSEAIRRDAASAEVARLAENLRMELTLDYPYVLIGLDRIDYTKGIPERLLAVSRFIEKYPEYRERFVFLQLGFLSRMHIQRYKDLNDEINDLVEQINWKHSTDSWQPILFMRMREHLAENNI